MPECLGKFNCGSFADTCGGYGARRLLARGGLHAGLSKSFLTSVTIVSTFNLNVPCPFSFVYICLHVPIRKQDAIVIPLNSRCTLAFVYIPLVMVLSVLVRNFHPPTYKSNVVRRHSKQLHASFSHRITQRPC